jgi:hypothetical protein
MGHRGFEPVTIDGTAAATIMNLAAECERLRAENAELTAGYKSCHGMRERMGRELERLRAALLAVQSLIHYGDPGPDKTQIQTFADIDRVVTEALGKLPRGSE